MADPNDPVKILLVASHSLLPRLAGLLEAETKEQFDSEFNALKPEFLDWVAKYLVVKNSGNDIQKEAAASVSRLFLHLIALVHERGVELQAVTAPQITVAAAAAGGRRRKTSKKTRRSKSTRKHRRARGY